MQISHALIKKGFLAGIAVLLLVSTVLFISSCKDKNKDPIVEPDAAVMKMPVLILTRATVQQWVDSGWTNPASPSRIKVLLMQFISANTSDIKTNMRLGVYPGMNMMNVHGRYNLGVDSAGLVVPISGAAIFGNNVLNLDPLGIFKADGTLSNFSFLRLRPTNLLFPPFVTYECSVVTNSMAVDKEGSNPCPPCQYCNPPSCGAFE